MGKYLWGLLILICLAEPAAAISDSKFDLSKLTLNPFKLKFNEAKTSKITKDVTLRVNKDLFVKGAVLKSKAYGKYYANLDVSNLFDLRHPSTTQDKFSSFQKRNSMVTGGLKVGHVVTKESRLFLRLGFESKNLAKGNALKTIHLTPASQGYWKTDLDSGVGIEHDVTRNVFVTGEVRTNLSSGLARLSEAQEPRHGTVRLGLKYFLGDK